jgi:hypothetical protein
VHEAVEEPEFLAAPKAAPSADDMAVFEQVMGAVLKPQPAPVEAPASEAAPEVVAEGAAPETPAEREALVAPGAPEAPAPVEDVAPAFQEALAAEEAPVFEEAPALGPISPAELSEIPVAPVLEEEAQRSAEPSETPTPPAPSFTPTGDLEKDLLALGLGELPDETPEPDVREPLGALETEPPTVEVEQVSTDAALTELLRSLGGEEEAAAPAEAEEAPKVISTDAYLAEFETDVTLTSALTDEITALTGGGSGKPRPTTTVAKLPEPGEQPTIHRDRLVDRDLVLKIIDGIEKL